MTGSNSKLARANATLFFAGALFHSTFAHSQDWNPKSRPATSAANCGKLLERTEVREVLSVAYDLDQLFEFLRHYQKKGREMAGAETAYSPDDYISTSNNPEVLRGHCGAMVWFIQRRFGGTAVLKQYVAANGDTDSNGNVLQMWHMHNASIPALVGGKLARVSVDLTKSQFSSEEDNLVPISNNELVYQGVRYVHRSGEHLEDLDYRWDLDTLNPPRLALEEFAIGIEFGVIASRKF